MPSISPSDLRTTIYVSGSYDQNADATYRPTCTNRRTGGAHQPLENHVLPAANDAHSVLNANSYVSFTFVPEPVSGGKLVKFGAPTPGGPNAVFLPFFTNHISSCLLPHNGAHHIKYFFTDNLSGCAIFVDRVTATGDLLVYHGNAIHKQSTNVPFPDGTAPTAAQADSRGSIYMNGLHYDALNGFVAAGTYAAIERLAVLMKDVYYAGIATEIQRKQQQGRMNVTCGGAGTNVIGFYRNQSWEFWYQTWGLFEYDRPADKIKVKYFGQAQQVGLTPGTGRIVGCGRFYPP